MNIIECVIQAAGGLSSFTTKLNERLSRPITYQAIRKWAANGHLPRTEWTGETNYSGAIEQLFQGRYTREQLLAARPTARGGSRTRVGKPGLPAAPEPTSETVTGGECHEDAAAKETA